MFPSSFEFHAPTTLAGAHELMARYGDDGKLVAGGHSLIPLMKLRLAEPKHLVDLGESLSSLTSGRRTGALP